jgi:hypothetical protein
VVGVKVVPEVVGATLAITGMPVLGRGAEHLIGGINLRATVGDAVVAALFDELFDTVVAALFGTLFGALLPPFKGCKTR